MATSQISTRYTSAASQVATRLVQSILLPAGMILRSGSHQPVGGLVDDARSGLNGLQPDRVHPGAGDQGGAEQRERDFEQEAEDFTEHGAIYLMKTTFIGSRQGVNGAVRMAAARNEIDALAPE